MLLITKVLRTRLRPLRKGMRTNIFDNMLAMMEKYANNLEALVGERTQLLIEEKQKTDALLHEMLPRPVADQLKQVRAGTTILSQKWASVELREQNEIY